MQKSLDDSRDSTRDLSVLSDLKRFEAMHEQNLEKAQQNAEKEIQGAKVGASEEIEKTRVSFEKKSEKAIQSEKEKAKKQAGKLFTDFKDKESDLRNKFSKNKSKAVEAAFKELLGGD